MLDICLKDHTRNEDFREKMNKDYIARQDNKKWIKRLMRWHKRSRVRPYKRWLDDISEKAGKNWHSLAEKERGGLFSGVGIEKLLKNKKIGKLFRSFEI